MSVPPALSCVSSRPPTRPALALSRARARRVRRPLTRVCPPPHPHPLILCRCIATPYPYPIPIPFPLPMCARYKEAFVKGKSVFIVMEFAPLGDVFERIDKCKQKGIHLKEEWILRWVAEVCLALQYIHGRGMVRRTNPPRTPGPPHAAG